MSPPCGWRADKLLPDAVSLPPCTFGIGRALLAVGFALRCLFRRLNGNKGPG